MNIKLIISPFRYPTKDNAARNRYEALPKNHFRGRENKRFNRIKTILSKEVEED